MADFIPQFMPWFDDREADAVDAYMRAGGWLTEFQETKKFGDAIAEYTGARFCSVQANGTVTMTAALWAMGIGKDDEVIVPDYTMIATANAVRMADGAVPVFADVELATMCLDVDSVAAAITPRTKAVMLVSINGRYPNRLEELVALCEKRGIALLEDAAQSLGSFYKGRHIGRAGKIASFSFSMPKIITTGQGGALITDDEDLYKKVELVKNFGRVQAGVDMHVFFGVNFKFTDLQAVVGQVQMSKVPERVPLKRDLYHTVKGRLAHVKQVRFFENSDDTTPWFNDALVEDRAALIAHLKARGIGSRSFYPPVHTQAPYNGQLGRFPVAEYLAANGLWLPSHPQMSDNDVDRIVVGVESFYKGRA